MLTRTPSAVAERVDESLKPDMTALFGSRARGDYRPDSDIDVMLVCRYPPTEEDIEKAQEQALEVYGRRVAVQLVWRSPEEFREGRRYWNSIETRAVREGLTMRRDPEGYGSSEEFDPEDAETERDWRQYQKFSPRRNNGTGRLPLHGGWREIRPKHRTARAGRTGKRDERGAGGLGRKARDEP